MNKATAEIRAYATKFGPKAIREAARLGGLAPGGKGAAVSEAARVAALNIVLERAYGKATHILAGDDERPPVQLSVIERRIVRPADSDG